MNRLIALLFAPAVLLLMAGCTGDSDHQDLHRFMEQQRQQPGGEIEPLPTPQPYATAKYQAFAMRSPFDEPVLLVAASEKVGSKTVKPDENRVKEYLERVNFSALSMVGTLSQDGQIWPLLDDGSGTIHRVAVGNYIGKNHGRIVSASHEKLDVIEIVPDGKGGWLELPRALSLQEKE